MDCWQDAGWQGLSTEVGVPEPSASAGESKAHRRSNQECSLHRGCGFDLASYFLEGKVEAQVPSFTLANLGQLLSLWEPQFPQ